MRRASRATGWLLHLAVLLARCAQGTDSDVMGGDQDSLVVDPDLKGPDDDAPEATGEEPDGSLDPSDASWTLTLEARSASGC